MRLIRYGISSIAASGTSTFPLPQRPRFVTSTHIRLRLVGDVELEEFLGDSRVKLEDLLPEGVEDLAHRSRRRSP